MSKKNRKNNKIELGSMGGDFSHNPFAALATADLPDVPEGVEAPKEVPAKSEAWSLSQSKRLTLRCETKHRGGRTVTLVEGIEGAEKSELKALGKWLGKRLGCGSKVEAEGVLLIQGDQRERLPELLEEKGAKEVRVLNS